MEFPSDCMRAMCEADSGCVPKGCDEDIHGRYGCGYFRLNIYHYKVWVLVSTEKLSFPCLKCGDRSCSV